MKWALASVGLLTLIVVFSLAALNQKNVVWENGVPHCPHCRAVVNDYSNLCATCGQAFDWETWEGPCKACFSKLDADWIRAKTRGKDAEVAAAFVAQGLSEEAARDFVEYVHKVESGACAFCGGTGRWLAPGVGEPGTSNGETNPLTVILSEKLEGRCPVCLGSGKCVVCDGDHQVVHAREAAARDLADARERLSEIDPHRDRESADAAWEVIRSTLQRDVGMVEIMKLPSFDEPSDTYIGRAMRRRELVMKVIAGLK